MQIEIQVLTELIRKPEHIKKNIKQIKSVYSLRSEIHLTLFQDYLSIYEIDYARTGKIMQRERELEINC